MRAIAARSLIAAVLCFTALRAQTASPPSYRHVVESFLTTPNAAIEQMLAMDATELARAVHDASGADSGWSSETLEAAMLMHTDAAIGIGGDDPEKAWANIQLAQALSDGIVRDPENTWFVHQWYTVVTAAFQHDARAGAMRERWRQQGWYHTAAAMDRARFLEGGGAMPNTETPSQAPDVEIYDALHFRLAVPYFEEALAGDVLAAAVHLGRIQMLRGHDAEARRLFDRAAGASHTRTTVYLANLFLGSMDERDGHPDAAQRRYRTALAALPRAQSGHMALTALLARGGRSDEARVVLAELYSKAPKFDPWWTYLPPDTRDFAMVLAELHAEIGQ
jgi:tetratricopeptide (TPR) repeat protein